MTTMNKFITLIISIIILTTGCRTTTPQTKINNKDIDQVIESIGGSLSGKELSEDDIKRIKKQLRNDPEAQSAVQAVSEGLDKNRIRIKFCPLTGKRYGPNFKLCPEHNVDLQWVE